MKNLGVGRPLPNSAPPHLPSLVDSNIGGASKDVSFASDFRRTWLFKDRMFYFLTEKQVCVCVCVCVWACVLVGGGRGSIWDNYKNEQINDTYWSSLSPPRACAYVSIYTKVHTYTLVHVHCTCCLSCHLLVEASGCLYCLVHLPAELLYMLYVSMSGEIGTPVKADSSVE